MKRQEALELLSIITLSNLPDSISQRHRSLNAIIRVLPPGNEVRMRADLMFRLLEEHIQAQREFAFTQTLPPSPVK